MRLHQTKKLCIAKELINKMNKPKKWEKKMFANYTSNYGLKFKIYK